MNYALYIYDTDCEDWQFEQDLEVNNYADAVVEAKHIAAQCAYRVRWQIRDADGRKL